MNCVGCFFCLAVNVNNSIWMNNNIYTVAMNIYFLCQVFCILATIENSGKNWPNIILVCYRNIINSLYKFIILQFHTI